MGGKKGEREMRRQNGSETLRQRWSREKTNVGEIKGMMEMERVNRQKEETVKQGEGKQKGTGKREKERSRVITNNQRTQPNEGRKLIQRMEGSRCERETETNGGIEMC